MSTVLLRFGLGTAESAISARLSFAWPGICASSPLAEAIVGTPATMGIGDEEGWHGFI